MARSARFAACRIERGKVPASTLIGLDGWFDTSARPPAANCGLTNHRERFFCAVLPAGAHILCEDR